MSHNLRQLDSRPKYSVMNRIAYFYDVPESEQLKSCPSQDSHRAQSVHSSENISQKSRSISPNAGGFNYQSLNKNFLTQQLRDRYSHLDSGLNVLIQQPPLQKTNSGLFKHHNQVPRQSRNAILTNLNTLSTHNTTRNHYISYCMKETPLHSYKKSASKKILKLPKPTNLLNIGKYVLN